MATGGLMGHLPTGDDRAVEPTIPNERGAERMRAPATSRPDAGDPPRGWRIAGVRPRLVGLILVAQAVMVWWVADSEIARSVYLICYSLMMPTVLYLLLGRVLQRWLSLDRQELLLGYIVLTATIPIVGFGGLRFLAPGMGY